MKKFNGEAIQGLMDKLIAIWKDWAKHEAITINDEDEKISLEDWNGEDFGNWVWQKNEDGEWTDNNGHAVKGGHDEALEQAECAMADELKKLIDNYRDSWAGSEESMAYYALAEIYQLRTEGCALTEGEQKVIKEAEKLTADKHISDFIENWGKGKVEPVLRWTRGTLPNADVHVDTAMVPDTDEEVSFPLHNLDEYFSDVSLGDDNGAGADDFKFDDEAWNMFCREVLAPCENRD